jgi:hypothetical protein
MNRTTLRTLIGGSAAAAALVVMTTAGAVHAGAGGGIRNCVDITGKHVNRVACTENVWAGDVQYRMTFSNPMFSGATPKDLDAFYVLAPQTDQPQGAPPNTFAHDHVVRDVPAHNKGSYSVKLQGYFVLCSGPGITSGDCVPTWTFIGGPDPLPLATTVDGQPLTSTDAIESAAAAGDVALLNLGPTAVIVGSISALH